MQTRSTIWSGTKRARRNLKPAATSRLECEVGTSGRAGSYTARPLPHIWESCLRCKRPQLPSLRRIGSVAQHVVQDLAAPLRVGAAFELRPQPRVGRARNRVALLEILPEGERARRLESEAKLVPLGPARPAGWILVDRLGGHFGSLRHGLRDNCGGGNGSRDRLVGPDLRCSCAVECQAAFQLSFRGCRACGCGRRKTPCTMDRALHQSCAKLGEQCAAMFSPRSLVRTWPMRCPSTSSGISSGASPSSSDASPPPIAGVAAKSENPGLISGSGPKETCNTALSIQPFDGRSGTTPVVDLPQ